MALVLVLVSWYAIGVASFAFWWTRDFRMKGGDWFLMAFAGITGPIAFVIGYLIHGRRKR